jgi:SpoVK/Ycf46/Vps4 family AAA+-type ATPase
MDQQYAFYSSLAKLLNSGQSRSVILYGNVYDLFWNGSDYVPLIPFLLHKTDVPDFIQITYELNGPIRVSDRDKEKVRNAWMAWNVGIDAKSEKWKNLREAINEKRQDVVHYGRQFDRLLQEALGDTSRALEFLRQLCICSRECLKEGLIIFIEAADMLLPAGNGDIASLNDKQLHRVAVTQDWFSDPAFVNSKDSVVLISESRGLIHPRISKMPQVVSIECQSPVKDSRLHYANYFQQTTKSNIANIDHLASMTAGLSIHALRQLLLEVVHSKGAEPRQVSDESIVRKVEEFIKAQVGEDVVEFKKPTHKLDAVIGNRNIKKFIENELIPRFRQNDIGGLSGCVVAGPIGGGKTFVFEAVATHLNMPVLVLKNLRSQWFGQTDVIFERLRRALEALEKVAIFIDEADTQFGGVGSNAHETERRLTGKIQAMMSDPTLRGRIIWILMTARVHLLSPDIRRPGRAGDLIIPILDPEGEDRIDFVRWVLSACTTCGDHELFVERLLPKEYSAADYAALRSHLKSTSSNLKRPLVAKEIEEAFREIIPANIAKTRRFQTLQALLNCTRRSLLPQKFANIEKEREQWQQELSTLEEYK